MKSAWTVACCLVLLPTRSMAMPRPVNRIAALVDDDVILLSDVEERASTDLARSQRTLLDLPPKERQRVLREALDSLIADKLLDAEVKSMSIEISDRDVDDEIEDLKKQNNMTTEQFDKALPAQGFTRATFHEYLRKNTARLRLLQLKVSSKVRISDEDVKAEYAKRQQADSAEIEVRVRQIFFRVPKEATPAEDKAILARAADITKRARTGEDFVELCKKYSEGPSRQDGGDLGYFRRGVMQAEVDRAVFVLKPDEVSDPVKSQWGYHVFKLVDRRKVPPPPFEQIRQELRDKLIRDQQAQYTKLYVDELRRAAAVDVKIPEYRGPETDKPASQ
jgi:peptidyl-prolyl cis-trans isomerase SurA